MTKVKGELLHGYVILSTAVDSVPTGLPVVGYQRDKRAEHETACSRHAAHSNCQFKS